MKKILFICILFFISFQLFSQADSTASKGRPQLKVGTFYISHLNYYGRSDSLQSSGFFPIAEFWFNDKVYLNAAPVFINNATTSFEYSGTVATVGYQGRSKNEKFFTHIYIVVPFYKPSSVLPQSVLKAQSTANISYLNKTLNFNGGIDFRLSDKMDYGISAGVDHLFKKKINQKTVLVLDPSAYVYAGTQQFTKTYYKKSSFLFFPGVEQQVNEDVSNLNVLSYELSMPIVLGINKFQVILNPSYVIPQNLIQIENRPEVSESGNNMFYLTAGVKFTL